MAQQEPLKGTRDWVTITHPELKDEEASVLRSSLRVYEDAGWTVKDDKKSSAASTRRQKKEKN